MQFFHQKVFPETDFEQNPVDPLITFAGNEGFFAMYKQGEHYCMYVASETHDRPPYGINHNYLYQFRKDVSLDTIRELRESGKIWWHEDMPKELVEKVDIEEQKVDYRLDGGEH